MGHHYVTRQTIVGSVAPLLDALQGVPLDGIAMDTGAQAARDVWLAFPQAAQEELQAALARANLIAEGAQRQTEYTIYAVDPAGLANQVRELDRTGYRILAVIELVNPERDESGVDMYWAAVARKTGKPESSREP